jgi:hypothetical protein
MTIFREEYLATTTVPKLHVGEGLPCLDGWLNTDVALLPGVPSWTRYATISLRGGSVRLHLHREHDRACLSCIGKILFNCSEAIWIVSAKRMPTNLKKLVVEYLPDAV